MNYTQLHKILLVDIIKYIIKKITYQTIKI